jgi:hypothetical protein
MTDKQENEMDGEGGETMMECPVTEWREEKSEHEPHNGRWGPTALNISAKDRVSHPYKTTGIIRVLYTLM